jgi:hypothetical protein
MDSEGFEPLRATRLRSAIARRRSDRLNLLEELTGSTDRSPGPVGDSSEPQDVRRTAQRVDMTMRLENFRGERRKGNSFGG